MRRTAAALILLLAGCSRREAAPRPVAAEFADPRTCAACHADIARTYAQTGMAKAFARVKPGSLTAEKWNARLDHPPSNRSYELIRRDTGYFIRRTAPGIEPLELEIHYVMGSGLHARSYVHRTPQGRLVELPAAWYPEKGGYFAMSPGYDRPDHQDFRRKISTDCMFCHNGYPAAAPGAGRPASEPVFPATLPEGIDCQRCHGPARAHADSGGRAPVVNPAKLPLERGMEICMQCHLETTSFPLPNSLIRFGRGAYSYRPGEPLADFVLHFDHAPAAGRGGKFEIVNSVYRLRQSKCFTASGKMQCTTCHDPHRVPRGADAEASYSKACRQCHAAGPHPERAGCVSCHMPKRRSEDVVHAVMTDHLIQRKPPANPLGPLAERHETPGKSYVGEVVPYYPAAVSGEAELESAVAQVVQRSNLKAGIPRLEALIARSRPRHPQPEFALAQALAVDGQRARAIEIYRALLVREPRFVPALRNLGELLRASGNATEAAAVLERAKAEALDDPGVLLALGQAYRETHRLNDAASAIRAAIANDADFPEAHDSLGGVLLEAGRAADAEAALREAIRHRPDFAEARANLAQAMALRGDLASAERQFREAARLAPGSPEVHYGYGAALLRAERIAGARIELETAIRLRPGMVEAREALGTLLSAEGDWSGAAAQYREVLRLDSGSARASLGLGSALAAQGAPAEARRHLDRAIAAGDEAVRKEAREVLEMLGAR